jgi:type II secretory pathway pseudopilin PulG
MVVLLLLSAVLALAIPHIRTPGEGLKEEAREVAAVLRAASENAALRKRDTALTFHLDEGTLSHALGGPGEEPATTELRWLRGVELQSRGMVRRGELTVFFGPLGLGERLSVHLARKGEELVVTYNPVSGRVKVEEG